jgi:hypothetical protein
MRRAVLLIAVLALVPVAAGSAKPATHVKVYFLAGEQLAAVPRTVPKATPVVAIRALLAGPTKRERNAGYKTALPAGTTLIRLTSGAGHATVTLRTPGRDEDNSLLAARAAQVTFTLKALGVDQVALILNGHSVATPHSTAPDIPPPEGPPDLEPDVPAPADPLLVQTQLRSMRFLPKEAVTGKWDYRTEQAVIGAQAWNNLDRDGQVGPITSGALAQAVIPSPTITTPGRHIEVYRALGVALLVNNGVMFRAIHVSTGRPGFETPAGQFTVFRKERFSWSAPYKVWLPYASYFHNGVAFHAYPEVPSTPASHGCVRVSYPEASLVYAFATLGTTVYVY